MSKTRVVVAHCFPIYDSAFFDAMESRLELFNEWPEIGHGMALKACAGRGQPVSLVREKIAKFALAEQRADEDIVGTGRAADILLWQDGDVALSDPRDAVRLVERLLDAPPEVMVMGAPCIMQEVSGNLTVNVALRDGASSLDEPYEALAIGLGLVAVRAEAFKLIPPPWFDFEHLPDGKFIGEDIGFCDKVRLAGGRVFVDPTVNTIHCFRRAFDMSAYNRLAEAAALSPKR